MPEIAIFSTSIDEPTYGGVAEKLERRGYNPWIYRADKILSGSDSLKVCVKGDEEIFVEYNNTERRLIDIKSAWFRHPDILNLNLDDKAKQQCIEQEVSALQESFWQQIPDDSWLNHPQKMKRVQPKLAQLALANELGFQTPQTVVSNSWSEVDKLADDGPIVIKMPRGLIYSNDQAKVLYTTRLDKSRLETLKENNPFPAIYQEYLRKYREWRITVVGEEVFQASIYTQDHAKDDWRRHQLTSKVRFKRESMLEIEISRCAEFLNRAGLIYGAFDFVEDYEGKITFLECNTNGQYKWLEEQLDLPISDAITDKLVKIAEDNKS